MKTYVDANVLVRMYLQLPGRDEALALLTSREARSAWPISVTNLLFLEVSNAIPRMVFESRTGGRWRVTPEAAAVGLAEFSEHIQEGTFLKRLPLGLADFESEFTSLAARHTAKHGFRTYDIVHVASAITMRCRRFFSFDTKARALAKLAGLETN